MSSIPLDTTERVAPATPHGPARKLDIGRPLLRLASIIIFLLAWQWLAGGHVNLGVVTFQNVPAPNEVLSAGWTLLHSPKLLPHLLASVSRVFSGFLVAALIGIGLGLLIGRFGIGYYTWMSYTIQNYPEIVVGMLFIGVFGMGSSLLVKRLGHALMPWHLQEEKKS